MLERGQGREGEVYGLDGLSRDVIITELLEYSRQTFPELEISFRLFDCTVFTHL